MIQPYSYYPTAYGYNPYNTQYQQPQQPQAVQSTQNNGIQWVQGEAGAKAHNVGAGQSVMLMDCESNVFYIKTTDGSGMPLPLRIFDYQERTPQNAQKGTQSAAIDTSLFVTRTEFEERIAALTAPAKTLCKDTEGN